jgi:hypothetical protein
MVSMYLNFFSSQETGLGFGESLNEVKHPGSFQGFYLCNLFLVQKIKAKEGRMLCLCSITMQQKLSSQDGAFHRPLPTVGS